MEHSFHVNFSFLNVRSSCTIEEVKKSSAPIYFIIRAYFILYYFEFMESWRQ